MLCTQHSNRVAVCAVHAARSACGCKHWRRRPPLLTSRAALAIRHVRRARELGALPDRHLRDALIPALNHLRARVWARGCVGVWVRGCVAVEGQGVRVGVGEALGTTEPPRRGRHAWHPHK
jgi:hypothetical protein